MLLPTQLMAQQAVVVELFTSAGCSSCPPADALLHNLSEQDDIIALGWHVDYWDYLGWKDEFADPRSTERQNGYRERWGLKPLYTPQMVIHGETQLVGSYEEQVRHTISHFKAEMPMIEITTSVSNGYANIIVSPKAAPLPASEIFLVNFVAPSVVSQITGGENNGKSIVYVNVVRNMQRIGEWNGQGAVEISDINTNAGMQAVIVQANNFGPIFGAAYID